MKIVNGVIIVIGIMLLCGGGWLAWQNAHPKLSEKQQISANLQAISEAAARHSSGGVLDYLATDFQWNGHNRHDVASLLSGAMFEFNQVKLQTDSVKVRVNGTSAVSTGNYEMTVVRRKRQAPQVYLGRFRIEWEKQDGSWLMVEATTQGDAPV